MPRADIDPTLKIDTGKLPNGSKADRLVVLTSISKCGYCLQMEVCFKFASHGRPWSESNTEHHTSTGPGRHVDIAHLAESPGFAASIIMVGAFAQHDMIARKVHRAT